MPGLTLDKELRLLEDKIDNLVQRIEDSGSSKELPILLKEYDRLINEINFLFKLLNPCLD